MAEKIEAYKPSCCNKAVLTRASALRHERNCLRNPENRACNSCKYLRFGSETVYNPHHGGNAGSTDYERYYYYCKIGATTEADSTPFNDYQAIPKRNCEQWEFNK